MSDYQDPVFAVNPANSSQLPVPFIDTVVQAINATKYILSGLSGNSQRDYIMGTAFGLYNQESANQILTAWAQNNFTNTPHIELVFGQNFNGAYAKDNNTIYSGEFLGANKDNIEAVTGVLVEEVGHYLDSQINVQDAAGDEGDIFSRLVRGQSISAGELVLLKSEDDHGVFVVDGVSVGIQKNVTIYENGQFGGAQKTYSQYSPSETYIGNDWNDKISSISIDPGWVVEAYEHSNFTGQKVVWTSSQSYVGNTWNDKISSLNIYQIPPRTKSDLNGDGRDDVIVRLPDGNVNVWLVDAQGKGTTPTRVGWADPAAKIVGIGDLNGDKRDDVIVRLPDGNVDVWLVDAQGKGTTPTRVGWADPAASFQVVTDLIDNIPSNLDTEIIPKWSKDQQRNWLGINPNYSAYSSSGNKFVATNGSGGTSLWCTDYAYGRAIEKGLFQNNRGIGETVSLNAGSWDDQIGLSNVKYTPRINSFIIFDSETGGTTDSRGHVGFVEQVYADGSFLISESNWGNYLGFGLRHLSAGTKAKFIYL